MEGINRCIECDNEVFGTDSLCQSCKLKLFGNKEMEEKAIQNYPLNNRNKDAFQSCKNFKESNRGVYLFGPAGHGKTLIAKTIWQYMGGVVPFIKIPMLLLEIRKSFEGNGKTESEIIESCLSHPVLFMDDFAAEKVTERSMETLYIICDQMEENGIRPFITSNLDLKELTQRFCDRIVSRITGMCDVVKLIDTDHRIKNRGRQL